ncbi:polysaccharide biosynthesis protein [Photobacterium chitinilyticum]|uniref:Polysaccharide biosynthesis protein n=1 Tax=Photobacterium chitinilyticum TaxID=2485123 RepID=A0A444JU55_9GAMM|nr:nucleoside-diphosphate sugar epimerase/dehydratase [Photobacterium chitinilyticum]RWX56599.1 polysaccharide biosynthesis protein [Photobacterium chitinilyticum]
MSYLDYIFSIPRPAKRLISTAFDTLFIAMAFWGAFWTRFGDLGYFADSRYWQVLGILVVSTLFLFIKVGLYRAILRYLSVHALLTIVISVILSSLFLALSAYFSHTVIPRSIPVIYGTYLVALCGGSRLLVRILVSQSNTKRKPRVLIYGAGASGRQLSNLLRQGDEYHPVAFLDDDRKLQSTVVHGLTVYHPKHLKRLFKKTHVEKILLAMPSATRAERKAIISSLVQLQVEVLSIPNLADIVNGSASIDQLCDVPIEDLLGRDCVAPQPELLEANIKNKVVMVTGAGGSIGSELCRQIVLQKPKALVLFELSEFGLYMIDKELSEFVQTEGLEVEIIPLLGSVQRQNRLVMTMQSFKVQTLYHAAAYKHVPLVEYNVVEGVRNNVFGTYYTALAAIEAGVESFVLISTDKAVRPTNVMGTTKRLAELALQSLAAENTGTRFCMVRFGNVLGSSGSVIPLFKRQIAAGGPVTVTHPDIIRYFMTIPEAAQLVIQAGAMGKGGDVFVLDMGEPVKIVDLAKNLIQLSGLEVMSDDKLNGDIEINYTGLRPGEKLFEELLIGDNVGKTEHERIMTANEIFLSYEDLKVVLTKLDEACHKFEHEKIRQILLDTPTGFNPTDGIGDLVWHATTTSKQGMKKVGSRVVNCDV